MVVTEKVRPAANKSIDWRDIPAKAAAAAVQFISERVCPEI